MPEPSIPELEDEVADLRKRFQEAIDAAVGPNTSLKWNVDAGNDAVPLLVVIAEQAMAVQKAKLRYEDAWERLQTAHERERQRLSDASQGRLESMQKSMTAATWAIAALTLVLAVAAAHDACK
jgi:hypothetical protein